MLAGSQPVEDLINLPRCISVCTVLCMTFRLSKQHRDRPHPFRSGCGKLLSGIYVRMTCALCTFEIFWTLGESFNAIQWSGGGFDADLLADALPHIRRGSIHHLGIDLIVANRGDRFIENEIRIVTTAVHLLPSI